MKFWVSLIGYQLVWFAAVIGAGHGLAWPGIAGMLLYAAQALNIDLASSWMVGDRWRDVDCGHAAGCKTIFIEGNYLEHLKQKPDFSARHLPAAADIILRESK